MSWRPFGGNSVRPAGRGRRVGRPGSDGRREGVTGADRVHHLTGCAGTGPVRRIGRIGHTPPAPRVSRASLPAIGREFPAGRPRASRPATGPPGPRPVDLTPRPAGTVPAAARAVRRRRSSGRSRTFGSTTSRTQAAGAAARAVAATAAAAAGFTTAASPPAYTAAKRSARPASSRHPEGRRGREVEVVAGAVRPGVGDRQRRGERASGRSARGPVTPPTEARRSSRRRTRRSPRTPANQLGVASRASPIGHVDGRAAGLGRVPPHSPRPSGTTRSISASPRTRTAPGGGTRLTAPPRSCGPDRLELLDRARVLLQRHPVADEYGRVEDSAGEQRGGPLVAVQHRHRAGDGDLLVVDLVRLDDGRRRVVRDPELQERPALGDPAEAVLDGARVAGGVHDEVPAAYGLQFVGARLLAHLAPARPQHHDHRVLGRALHERRERGLVDVDHEGRLPRQAAGPSAGAAWPGERG